MMEFTAAPSAWVKPDPERLAAGWERRFVVGPGRAEEAVQLYRELGFDVAADPVRPEQLGPQCHGCTLTALLQLKTIYTRRRKA